MVKFFVSSTIPESSASASHLRMLLISTSSWIISVRSSQAEEAYGSIKPRAALWIYVAATRWWSITATRLQASRRSCSSTCSGRLVSTTTRRVFPSAWITASCGEAKALRYSGTAFNLSISGLAAEVFSSTITWYLTPLRRQMQHTPIAAPTASRSL